MPPRNVFKKRQVAAKEVKSLVRSVLGKFPTSESKIDRVVNARGKGITFKRIKGRIVPVRK